ncbi:hypothetical protein ESA94_06260 [Lacibacter luteus]|uniref:DUF3575 domain-containing protein n=1 Tax=Lacibacter luteus TaxID=2508719 RepID=A0A4Q1CPL9_9BACT|nr:hypothetical protein [Lacibacter luteus]RXK62599.1 hypothetical protein ESA94_06260 [Lacibacter luteus]
MRRHLHFIYLVIFSLRVAAQQQNDSAFSHHHDEVNNARSIAAVIGYKYYGRSALELGLGYYRHQISNHGHLAFTVYGGAELAAYSKGTLVAPKIGAWVNGSITTMGVSMLQFMHGDEKNLVLRPEIGVGLLFFRIYYAYNWTIKNKGFQPVSRNMLGVSLTVPLSKHLYSETK